MCRPTAALTELCALALWLLARIIERQQLAAGRHSAPTDCFPQISGQPDQFLPRPSAKGRTGLSAAIQMFQATGSDRPEGDSHLGW
jgi:hypothetical protein